MKLLIATTNMHKLREFRMLLKGIAPDIDIISLLNFSNYKPLDEVGVDFEEIAITKATHAARSLNLWTLGEDSGLVVPALGGAPGVFSRRYAGLEATDAENRRKLLKEMATFNDLERTAYFTCAIALASPEGLHKTAVGLCEGYISMEERGSNGFGYDSIFIKHDYDKSFAELDENTKNKVSHRFKALEKLKPALQTLQGSTLPK